MSTQAGTHRDNDIVAGCGLESDFVSQSGKR